MDDQNPRAPLRAARAPQAITTPPTREAELAALADALRDDPAALAMEARIDGQTYVAVRADVGLAVRIECRGT